MKHTFRMKRSVFFLLLLLCSLSSQAVVYCLQKVDHIKSYAQFVMVHHNKAITTTLNDDGALLSDTLLPTTDLLGTENHVWTIYQSGNYYVLKKGAELLVLKEKDSNYFRWSGSGTEAGIRWTVTFQSTDSSMSFKYAENQYLTATDKACSKYKIKTASAPKFYLYQLVPMTYNRAATIGQLGTICLPYAVDSVAGADVYQISYLEKDKEGNPYKLYYEEVKGDLVAGRPYLYVPTAAMVVFQKKDTVVTSEPLYFGDGFHGTFGDIIDVEAGTPGNVLEGNYMVYNNTFQKCGGNCRLQANRAYINMSEVPTTKPSQAVAVRRLSISQTGVEYYGTTELEEMTNDKPEMRSEKRIVDGRLVIHREGKDYSVMGYTL